MEDKSSVPQRSVKWLEDLSKGTISHDLELITLDNIRTIEARQGYIRCNFIVPIHLADEDGNWQVGAMATLVDTVGAATVYSFGGRIKATADFNISFYSTAKIQEEVEIEAKVVGERGKLTSVQIEVRRRDNGEVIAFGKQWMAQVSML
ncbi:hypothetical protein Q3G72_017845 [Acer saccharum]|nr:hypothetical protein Q3G72_017845 [Acer saccharum]